MKCKRCKREIPDNSIFCNWCGHQQLTASTDVRVPVPRRKGNTWYAQVMIADERVYISADSEDEYYAKARAAKTRQIEIKKCPAKMTLGEAMKAYIKANDATLSPSTLKAYKSYAEHRFPKYADQQIDRIDFQRMINEESKLVSPKTVKNAWRLATAAMRYKDVDPPDINLPQAQKNERPWLDYEQVKVFCTAVRGKECELPSLMALNGLRRSEILYLTADDIDITNAIIAIHGARVVSPDGGYVDKDIAKNATSTRSVKIIIPRLLELLRNRTGRLVTAHPSAIHKQINRICRQNGLPEVGFHGLRHSYISLGFHLGVQDLTIASQVGHATVATTHNIYRHLAERDRETELKRVSDFFNN